MLRSCPQTFGQKENGYRFHNGVIFNTLTQQQDMGDNINVASYYKHL